MSCSLNLFKKKKLISVRYYKLDILYSLFFRRRANKYMLKIKSFYRIVGNLYKTNKFYYNIIEYAYYLFIIRCT